VLVAELQINIAWRWFIGLGLLEKTPDHSTLCDFRQRLGPEVFVQVLARLLSICLERGLIRNVDLYFDFTAVHASGVLFKPYQRALLLALAVNR
jgi:transposase